MGAAFDVALGAALAGSLLLAVLLLRASAQAARPLAAFLLTVGLWSVGLLLPNRLGAALLALAPVGGATFLHFAATLAGRGRRLVVAGYATGLALAVAAAIGGVGEFVPWPGIGRLFRYGGAGLLAVAVTVALALLGHGLLVLALRDAAPGQRPQLRLVLASSAIGLAAASGLGFPLVGVPAAPWPLLAEPGYVLLLGYAMLRYRLMAVNEWAVRAVSFALLIAGAAMAAALLAGAAGTRAGIPFAATAAALLAGVALAAPVRRLAERLVYPGGELSAADLAAWRAALEEARGAAEIEAIAGHLARRHLRLQDDAPLVAADLPPGPRRVLTTLDDLAGQARLALARRRELAERDRLAELGALAATVAHDLRNPMNIVAMAVADAEPATRREVQVQLRRMEALVRDLLDYAKPWRVEKAGIALAEFLAAWSPPARLDCPPGATVEADPARLQQALANLVDNAAAAGGAVLIAVEQTTRQTVIRVCDDGPGIPEDIRASLFQPFVSRSPGGTGLGLAIVAKVMAAHGGSAGLEDRPGWTTCIALRFPA